MKDIKLTDQHYDIIMGIALDYFKQRPAPRVTRDSNFLSRCYVDAVADYFANKGWTLKDGKVYENKKTKVKKKSTKKKLQSSE